MRHHASLFLALFASTLAVAGCHHHRKSKTPDQETNQNAPQAAQPAGSTALAATGSAAGLTRVTSDGVDETEPQLSPDGKVLIFVAWQQVADANGNNVVQTSVLGADPSNGSARTIYTNANAGANWPTWTPKGSLVYASMTTGTQSLVRTLTNAPNAAFTVIIDGKTAQSPSWPSVSPEGTRIAFEATMNGVETIVTAGADGSRLTVLGPGFTPSWSPNGKQLAFSRQVGNAYEIMTMDAASGANLTQVTNSGCSSNKPKFSPDSRYIVFESNCGWNTIQGGSDSTTFNIFAVKPDGTGLTQLTTGVGESGQPFWGKDGFIYFESNSDGTANRDIWKLQPTGDLAGPAVVVTPANAPPGTGGPSTPKMTKGAGTGGAPKPAAPASSTAPKW
jgi:TolB protein